MRLLSATTYVVLGIGAYVAYLWKTSTIARPTRDRPCPPHGILLRILYAFFASNLAERILAYMLHTKSDEPQAPQVGGTLPLVVGDTPALRVKVIPILGAAFGGNYSYLVWDENDPDRRAMCVDPADPQPVLRAAADERLNLEVLLVTHWHFDHAGGNRAIRRAIPGVRIVAAAAEQARVPCANERVDDLGQVRVGSLVATAHLVPGHTLGSVVWEVRTEADPEAHAVAFTGDTLFCGGCGRLFESSATQFHDSLRRLRERLKPDCRLFSGHEYAVMLLTMAVRSEPLNLAARKKLAQVRELRRAKLPSVPCTFEEEMEYNPWMRASPEELALLCGCEN